MSKFQLSKDQIINGLVAPFVKAFSFALSLIANKELVQEIVEETQNAVGAVNVETPPNAEETVGAILKIADTLAEATPTQVDDALVDAAEAGSAFVFQRGAGIKTFWQLIVARLKAKKEAKAAEKAEEGTDTETKAGSGEAN